MGRSRGHCVYAKASSTKGHLFSSHASVSNLNSRRTLVKSKLHMHQQVVQASETAFEMRRLGQQVMRHGVDGAQKKRSSAIQLTNLSCKQLARCQSWTFLDLLLHRLDLSRPGVKVSGPCTVCGLCVRAVQRHLKDGQKHDGTGKRT